MTTIQQIIDFFSYGLGIGSVFAGIIVLMIIVDKSDKRFDVRVMNVNKPGLKLPEGVSMMILPVSRINENIESRSIARFMLARGSIIVYAGLYHEDRTFRFVVSHDGVVKTFVLDEESGNYSIWKDINQQIIEIFKE